MGRGRLSAIFGVFERRGADADPAAVNRMAAELEDLGREGSSRAGRGSVQLGHHLMDRRPTGRTACGALHDEDADLFLTGDLRLDNRPELAARLEIRGPEARVLSDSALALAAYERWGVDCPRHLLGDFAFAIWDRPRRRLFLTRDHFGIRPLFYTQIASLFLFASALRGLLCHPGLSRRLDDFMVARYLIFPSNAGGQTLYRSIHSLVPSHSLVVEAEGEPRLVPYWRPDPAARVFFRDEREYPEACREILTEAVRARVESASRVGVLVSGGLDSSALMAVATHLDDATKPLALGHVIQPSSPAAAHDERRFLALLADHLPGLDLRLVTAEGASPLDPIEEVFERLRLPVQAGLNYVHRALFEEAERAGCGVLLSGIGGDEVVSAEVPGYLPELFASLRPRRFLRELAAEKRRREVPAWPLWRHVLVSQLPRFVRHAVNFRRRGYLENAQISLREDLARSVDLRSRLNKAGGWWDLGGYWPPSVHGELMKSVSLLARQGLDAHNLVTQAAGYGLSLRFPLVDLRLVEFCLAIPADQMRRNAMGRRLMRRATVGLLPDRIRRRTDKGVFGPDFVSRIQVDLGRIRRGIDRFAADTDFCRYVDLDHLTGTIDRVARADPQTTDAARDGLADLLPAYYLGRFLELDRREKGNRTRV